MARNTEGTKPQDNQGTGEGTTGKYHGSKSKCECKCKFYIV